MTRERFAAPRALRRADARRGVAVNGVLVNYQRGMKTPVRDGDTVAFVKAAAAAERGRSVRVREGASDERDRGAAHPDNGGASGIGRLMALELAQRGGRISVWTSTREARQGGRRARVRTGAGARFHCDVAKREDVYASPRRRRARRRRGHPDQQRRRGQRSQPPRTPDEKIEATFAINTLSPFW